MGAQRKLQKLKAANDLPKRAPRVSIITLAPTPKTIGRFMAIGVLALGLGLLAMTLMVIQKETTTTSVDTAQLPTPQPTKLTRADNSALQVKASSLQPTAPSDDEQTVNVVAQKLSELPAFNKKSSLEVIPDQDGVLNEDLVRAHNFLESGALAEALRVYRDILSMDPRNHDALAGVVYIDAKSGELEKAIDASHKLLKFYPDDTAAKANLAGVLERVGRNEEAILLLDHAAREAPEHLPYRLALAALYDRTGHIREALMLYRQVLESAEHEESVSVPLAPIQKRIDYLEGSAPNDPSTTLPVDN